MCVSERFEERDSGERERERDLEGQRCATQPEMVVFSSGVISSLNGRTGLEI